MSSAIYILCALASLCCCILLARGYRRSGAKLLFWGSVCFAFLTANNVLLLLDLEVFPDVALYHWRQGTALAGMLLFLYGLIFESESQARK